MISNSLDLHRAQSWLQECFFVGIMEHYVECRLLLQARMVAAGHQLFIHHRARKAGGRLVACDQLLPESYDLLREWNVLDAQFYGFACTQIQQQIRENHAWLEQKPRHYIRDDRLW